MPSQKLDAVATSLLRSETRGAIGKEPTQSITYNKLLEVGGIRTFHYILLALCGVIHASDAVEILAVSFMLLNIPEDFEVSSTEKSVLASMIFVGMMIGGWTWGSLGDRIGRRTSLIISLLINSFGGFLSAFTPNFVLLLLARLIAGIGVGGAIPLVFTYFSEFFSAQHRGHFMVYLAMSWMAGSLFTAGMAWAIIGTNLSLTINSYTLHAWRIFAVVCCLPAFIGAIILYLFPESPRYLLMNNLVDEAKTALKRIYGKKIKYHSTREDVFDDEEERDSPSSSSTNASSVLSNNIHQVDVSITISNDSHKVSPVKRKTSIHDDYDDIDLDLIDLILPGGDAEECIDHGHHISSDHTKQSSSSSSSSSLKSPILSTPEQASSSSSFSQPIPIPSVGTPTLVESSSMFRPSLSQTTSYIKPVDADNNYSYEHSPYTNQDGKLLDKSLTFLDVENTKTTAETPLFSSKPTSFFPLLYHNLVQFIEQTKSLFQPSHRKTSQTILLLWLSLAFSYYGITMWMPSYYKTKLESTGIDEYLSEFLYAAANLPGNIISIYSVRTIGRSKTQLYSMVASCISLFLLLFIDSPIGLVVISCVYSSTSIPAWNALNMSTTELYPTSMRATAIGFFSASGRIGAIAGTLLFGMLVSYSPAIALSLTAGFVAIGAVCAYLLPESKDIQMD